MSVVKKMFGIIVVTAAALIFFFAHRALYPSDWVRVQLHQVPDYCSKIYIVVKENGEISPLNWYQFKIVAFSADPAIVGEQWNWYLNGRKRVGDIQWVNAESYGILCRTAEGVWMYWWIRADCIDSPPPLRHLVGGGSTVTIDASCFDKKMFAPHDLIDKVDTD